MNQNSRRHGPPQDVAFVLVIRGDGIAFVPHSDMCEQAAAKILRHIAGHLDTAHESAQCAQIPDLDPDGPPTEVPFTTAGGAFDEARRVWTDGQGHRWDLSLSWGDATDRTWRWTGRLDRTAGVPLMRSVDGDETEPLDVLRAMYGPIYVTAGGRS